MLYFITANTNDILTNLRAELSGELQQELRKSYTVDSEAYQAYLKGRYFSALWYLTQTYFHLNELDDSIATAERMFGKESAQRTL
ncbi:MAG: hypothetical protein ACE5IY_22960 [bacterium]